MIEALMQHDHPLTIRRLVERVEIEENMVFALETCCAASDGISAARIEEEIRVLGSATGDDVRGRQPLLAP